MGKIKIGDPGSNGPWALGLGPWALGLGPWALGLGPWALGLGPWALGPDGLFNAFKCLTDTLFQLL